MIAGGIILGIISGIKKPVAFTQVGYTEPLPQHDSEQIKQAINTLNIMGYSKTEAKKYVNQAVAEGAENLVNAACKKVKI
jgi:Holliday junction resolvasome RuvABC DNA-binding subunit